jgi:hypothetical protein
VRERTQKAFALRCPTRGTLSDEPRCPPNAWIDRRADRGAGRLWTVALGCVWLLNAAGCSSADDTAYPEATWIVAEESSVEIASGETDPSQIIFGVRGVLRQPNGDLIVANSGSQSLLAYDSIGSLLAEIGGRGEGPGEFQGMAGLGTCAGDTIVVWSGSRASLFDAERVFVRSVPTNRDGGGLRRVGGISSDCSKLLVIDRMPQAPTARSWPHVIRWLPEDGEPVTLREFPGRPMARVGESNRPLPFGPVPVWATDGDRVYLGLADRPEVLVFDGRGAELASIRWDADARPVTDQDRSTGKGLYDEEIAAEMQRLPPEVASQIPWPRWEDIPLAETKPSYSDLLVDDEGNLWVLEYPDAMGGQPELYRPRVGEEPEIWSVFNEDGASLGSVEMPSGLELLAVADGHAIGVFRDEFDVEVIRLSRSNRDALPGEIARRLDVGA